MIVTTVSRQPSAKGTRPLHRFMAVVKAVAHSPATGCLVPRRASHASGVMAAVAIAASATAPMAADRYGVRTE